MFNRNRDRNRKLATLAAVGVGLALIRGKRHMRRHAMAGMMGGPFGHGGRGGFGPWSGRSESDFAQMPLPPFIQARLKAWHERQHGTTPSASGQPSEATQL